MIKYILFDLDGTLLDFSKSEKIIIKKVIKDYANYELSIEDLNYFSKINEYWFNRFNDGYMTRIEYQIKRFDEFKKFNVRLIISYFFRYIIILKIIIYFSFR